MSNKRLPYFEIPGCNSRKHSNLPKQGNGKWDCTASPKVDESGTKRYFSSMNKQGRQRFGGTFGVGEQHVGFDVFLKGTKGIPPPTTYHPPREFGYPEPVRKSKRTDILAQQYHMRNATNEVSFPATPSNLQSSLPIPHDHRCDINSNVFSRTLPVMEHDRVSYLHNSAMKGARKCSKRGHFSISGDLYQGVDKSHRIPKKKTYISCTSPRFSNFKNDDVPGPGSYYHEKSELMLSHRSGASNPIERPKIERNDCNHDE